VRKFGAFLSMDILTNIPKPNDNETYEQFVIRAHHELFAAIPEPMDRNQAVWKSWEAYRGDNERYRARQFFPEDKFNRVDNVCYWHEHAAVSYDANGNPTERMNDVNRIAQIIHENNLRIADTDSFSAVVDKHNKQPERDPVTGKVTKPDDPNPPRTIGFTGPFRLGMIGRVNPRFAAFADEYQRRDKKDVFADRPRRSVEVLTLLANGNSYFDPIAALSESPRLPLPLVAQYQANGEEYERTIYEAVSALPGGSNTFIPGSGESLKPKVLVDTFSTSNTSPNSQQAKSMFGNQNGSGNTSGGDGNPDQTRTIVDAIMATPLMKFLAQFAQQNGFAQGGPPQQQHGGQATQHQFGINPMAAISPMAGAIGGGLSRYSADGTVIKPEDYVEYELDQPSASEQFSAMQASIAELMAENAKLRNNQVQLAAKSADAERTQQLSELHSRFPHFIDFEAEKTRCLYSAGSRMTEDDFGDHCTMLEAYAAKAPPVQRMVPGGESSYGDPADYRAVESAQYEAAVSSRATEIWTELSSTGRIVTANEAYDMAKSELSKKGTGAVQ
jgi:hypothetical protein